MAMTEIKQNFGGEVVTIKIYDDNRIVIEGFGPHTAFPLSYRVDEGYTDREIIREVVIRPTAIESTNPVFAGELQDHTNCTIETCRNWERFHRPEVLGPPPAVDAHTDERPAMDGHAALAATVAESGAHNQGCNPRTCPHPDHRVTHNPRVRCMNPNCKIC